MDGRRISFGFRVFWAGGGGDHATRIQAWSPGTSVTTVATGQAIEGIAVRDGFLYWGDDGVGSGITIFRVPVNGGNPVPVASMGEGTYGALLGVSLSDVVFVSDYMTADIYVGSMAGGVPRLLAHATPPWVNDLGWVDDAYLYWVEDNDETLLHRVPVAGGSVEVVPTQGDVESVAFDACNVYIGSTEPTQVLVLPR